MTKDGRNLGRSYWKKNSYYELYIEALNCLSCSEMPVWGPIVSKSDTSGLY